MATCYDHHIFYDCRGKSGHSIIWVVEAEGEPSLSQSRTRLRSTPTGCCHVMQSKQYVFNFCAYC